MQGPWGRVPHVFKDLQEESCARLGGSQGQTMQGLGRILTFLQRASGEMLQDFRLCV